jgi:hypothetical protein
MQHYTFPIYMFTFSYFFYIYFISFSELNRSFLKILLYQIEDGMKGC